MPACELAIPRHQIEPVPARGRIHKPKRDDLESGIIASILAKIHAEDPLIVAGKHQAVILDSPLPHHPNLDEPHIVVWTYEHGAGKEGEIVPWHDSSWEKVVIDGDFLKALEIKLDQMQNIIPSLPLRVYFFVGFAEPGITYPDHVYPTGLQSQIRWHIHAVSPLDRNHHFREILDLINENHPDSIAYTQIRNIAGERSLDFFDIFMEQFSSHPFIYHQILGRNHQTVSLNHLMFGFDSLQEALRQSLWLRNQVKEAWLSHAEKIYGIRVDENTGLGLEIMQSCVPNIAVVKPSHLDRLEGQTNENYKWWVMPFPVSGGQTLLTQGGVFLHRQGR